MAGSVDYKEEIRDCEVCGSTNFKLIWEKKAWSKAKIIKQGQLMFHTKDVMCMDCGIIYKNPMLTKDSQSSFYSGHYGSLFKPNQTLGISKAEIIEGIIKVSYMLDFLRSLEFGFSGKKILEVGTSMGVAMKGIQSLGADVHGLDLDKRGCEIANKLFNHTIANLDLFEYKPVDKYDLIVSCNTLEHFYSPKQALAKMSEFLQEDGRVLIELPSYKFPYVNTLIDAFLSSAHNYTFSFDSFEAMAKQCGFVIESWGYVGHHKSMEFLLKKGTTGIESKCRVPYDETLARFQEQGTYNDKINAIGKELSVSTNVTTIIDKVSSALPNCSNYAFIAFVPYLLQNGLNQHVIDLMGMYTDGQPEDIEMCEATFVHYKGVALRQMGDFLGAKECFLEAKERYPRFEDYNFIHDLILDGIISESGFTRYVWWNNSKLLADLG